MKDSRIKQIRDENNLKTERELRNKVNHLETEVDILKRTTKEDVTEKEFLLGELKEQLKELEEQRPDAKAIEFEGRVDIRLTDTDGFYLYTDETGNIDRGDYYIVEWGVKKFTPLLDGEIQDVMDYFNINDERYRVGVLHE